MLYRSGVDVDLSSSHIYDDFLADDDRPAEARAERDKYGLPIMPPSDPSMADVDMMSRNTTVKFQDRSDDESSVNGTESEVRN